MAAVALVAGSVASAYAAPGPAGPSGAAVMPTATETTPTTSQTPTPTTTPTPQAPGAAAESVVTITLDGLNPDAISRLGRRGVPTLTRLIKQGASTMNARTEYELTDTLPNHTGMVTGRRIDAPTGGHGVTWNDDRSTPPTVQAAAGEPVGSIFTAVHEAGRSTSLFASKTKFSLWQRSWPESIDANVIVENNKVLVDRFVEDFSTPRAFRFLHLSAPDAAGHDRGFMSKAYLRAVSRSDKQVARVIRAVKDSGTSTTVLITADHGGRGASHRTPSKLANYRIPFIAWGAGADRGADLYEINTADYRNPRRARTTYAQHPIRNGDVANLALAQLGLASIADSEFGSAQNLELAAP